MKKFIIILITLFIYSCSSTPKEKEVPFTVNLKSPRHTAGSGEAYFERYLGIGSLKKGDITVYYYPIEDAVCLNFRAMQFVHCDQFWDRAGRDAFVSAFERYKEEYDRRTLIVKKNRKTRDAYGTVQGYFAWKKTAVAVQAYGSPKIKLGYQFKGKGAFFTTAQMESYYEDQYSKTRSGTSPVTVMYFTRSQAESLAELFKQEYLNSLKVPGSSDTTIDEYEEKD